MAHEGIHMLEEEQINNQYSKRPEGLTILCILSFIGSGLALVSNLSIFLWFHGIIDIIHSEEEVFTLPNMTPEMMLDFLQSSGRFYFLISAILYLGSVFGVYLMWHLQKRGIHFYAMSQIALLIIPLLFISGDLSVLPSLLITAMFILLYSRFLKWMK